MRERLRALVLLPALLSPAVDELDGLRSSVAAVGDVDGDGIPDVLAASRDEGVPVVWVLSGADGSVLIERRGGLYGFGRTLSSAGDFDRDGFPDLIVGGPYCAVVFSGIAGGKLAHLEPPEMSQDYGTCVTGGADFDQDGFSDVAVGAPFKNSYPSRIVVPSRVWAYGGPRGHVIDVLVEEEATGLPAGPRRFGEVVEVVPDLPGKDRAGLLIGAPNVQDGGRGYADLRTVGEDRVVLRKIAPTIEHWTGGGWFGWNVTSAGDLNADGTTDLLVADVHSYVRAYSGKDGEKLLEIDYLGGFLHGEGTSLDGVGDLNGDGHADFLIGANESSMTNHSDQGWVWIHSGSDGELLYRYDPGLNPGPKGGYGVDAAGIGDVDCDGLTDIAVAVPRAGRIEILSGQDLSPLVQLDAATLRRR